MNKPILLFALCTLGLFSVLHAQKPELVLPAIHTNPISSLCYSGNGKYVATCAFKEVKLWELRTGRLVRNILSPEPIAFLDLSEDGTRLLTGGYCGATEYLEDSGNIPNINTEVAWWNMETGEKIKTIKAFGKPDRIRQVLISPDQRYAYAQHQNLLTIWEINTGKVKWEMEGKDGAAFTADGSLLIIGDTSLKLVDWMGSGKVETILQGSFQTVGSNKEYVVAMDQNGTLKRWDLSKKMPAPEVKPDLKDLMQNDRLNGGISLCFSKDATKMGVVSDETETLVTHRARVFEVQNGHLLSDKRWSEEISALGSWVAGQSPDLDFFITVPYTDVADNRAGMKGYNAKEGRFSHSFGLISLEKTTEMNMLPPRKNAIYNHGKIFFLNRDSAFRPMPNTVFLPESGLVITGLAQDTLKYLTDNKTLEEDSRWNLECTDGLSYQVTDKKSSKVVATLFLADGKYGYRDGGNGYTPGMSRVWAVTTPSGLFDASAEMMESLHYAVGMEILELNQLKERYYEPGLLSKIMGNTTGELRNVAAFNQVALYPTVTATIENSNLIITLVERNGGLGKLSLFVNQKEVAEDINPQRSKNLSIDLRTYAKYFLGDAPNTITLRTYNAEGWLKSPAFELPFEYTGSKGSGDNTPAPTLGNAKPHLYAILVGTANYTGDKLKLKYADQDAAAMAMAISSAGKQLFEDRVHIHLLTTGKNTPDKDPSAPKAEVSSKLNIQKAFEDYAKQAKPTDILLLYFSGHGVTYGEAEKGQFYYLTKDIASEDLSDPEVRKSFTISSNELTDWIKANAARKQVLILDACNSGKIVESLAALGQKDLNPSQIRALDRMKDRTGMFILTGAASNKVSFEASQYGQGLLTYSLLHE